MAATARERSPASEEAFHAALTKGGELLAANRVDEARTQLEHANTLVPKNEKTLNLLGLTYFKLGQFAQAAQVYEILASDNPVDPTLRVNLGLAYLKTNDLTRAVKEFETATDLEPEHKKAHNYLGLALAQVGDYQRARHHFVQAGSDAMAEKMGKAIAAAQPPRSVPLPSVPTESSVVALPGAAPAPPPQQPPAPPALPDDDSIEVMSDDDATTPEAVEESELIEDAVVATEPAPAASTPVSGGTEEPGDVASYALATDEALHAVATQSPVPAPPWLHATASEEHVHADGGYSSHDSVSDAAAAHAAEMSSAPATPDDGGGLVAVEAPADYAAAAPTWQQQPEGDTAPAPDSSWPHDGLVPVEAPVDYAAHDASAADSSWQTQEGVEPIEGAGDAAAPHEASAADPSWQQHHEAGLVPFEGAVDSAAPYEASAVDPSWQQEHEGLIPVEGAVDSGANAETPAEALQQHDALVPGEGPADSPGLSATDPVWEHGQHDAGLVEVEAPVDATIDAGPTEAAPEAASAAASEAAPAPSTASEMDWSEVSPSADERSAPSDARAVEPLPAAIDEVPADPAWVSQPLSEVRLSAAGEPTLPEPTMPTYEPRAVEVAHVDVEVLAPSPTAPAEVGAGYAPMGSQRLVELGAATQWVADASTGPFHLGADGLAVNVNGEMLVRLTNLVAVVGNIELKAETRRVRGRATEQPFGVGPAQLQRATGHGVLYLEPGRSTFHAIDLDDEGAYLREERVFAFEEPIAFDNGRLSDAGQTLDVVHLKGHGRVLLQLDGPLKAMPLPTAAPMVVPLNRLVGWFGRVTPRVVGFAGQGAVELTGEGHALLGAPAERGH